MSTLISLAVVDGDPRIDSRIVAAELGIDHKNTRELVDNYLSHFEELGILPFETAKPPQGSTGGRPEKFYLLNEDQTYFLMTLVRNTVQAVELKKRLVQAFAEARHPQIPATQSFDLATMGAVALRELANKIEEIAALNARVISMQPKADFYDHVAGNEALYNREDAAKILRTGSKRLWGSLRDWRIVQASGMPYQQYFDSGYFRLVPVLVHKGQYSIPYNQTMITGKGLTWLKALMDSRILPGKELAKVGGVA